MSQEQLPKKDDEIQAALNAAAQQGMSTELDFDQLPTPNQGLTSASEALTALNEAKQQGISTDLSFEELPAPNPIFSPETDDELMELDQGPRPSPIDDIQKALFIAARQKITTDVALEDLPPPTDSKPIKKVVKFPLHDVPPDNIPLPDFGNAPTFKALPQKDSLPFSDFWLLLALFVVFRLLTLLLLRPGGFIRDWSDFGTYLGIAQLSDYGLLPFLDFWLEWPPLLPWLAVGVYKLSLFLPPWPDDPRLWFVLILGTVFLLFEVGNFMLIYRLAGRIFHPSTAETQPAELNIQRVMWLYVGLFPPVYAMLGFFDCIALFFILLALELLLEERRFLSAIIIGVGFMVKLIPVLMLPVAARRLWHQHRQNQREANIEIALYGAIFGLTVIALMSPFLINGSQWVQASTRAMLGRSSWETVWAVAEGYYGFGVVLGDRLNPLETNFATHETILPWGLIAVLFAMWYLVIMSHEADYHQPRQMIALTGLTVTMLLLYSKGYSPQFLVYLLPFIILLFPDERGLVYALVLTGLNVLEQPIYFVMMPHATWLLTFIVMTRFGLLLMLAAEFVLVIWPSALKEEIWAKIYRRVPIILGGTTVITSVVLMPLLFQAYLTQRLNDSPSFALVNFMQTKANPSTSPPLLLSDPITYRELYPYLHQNFNILLAGGTAEYEQAPTVPDLLEGIDTVWFLPTGQQQQAVSDYLSTQGQLLAAYNFADFGTIFHYNLNRENMDTEKPVARFMGGIELLDYQIELQRNIIFVPQNVQITFFWQTTVPQRESYKVFAQILNSNGELVASHDSIPFNGKSPTNGWAVSTIQIDPHQIELPTLPPDKYTLITGMYNDFDERLLTAESNAITLRYQIQVDKQGNITLLQP